MTGIFRHHLLLGGSLIIGLETLQKQGRHGSTYVLFVVTFMFSPLRRFNVGTKHAD